MPERIALVGVGERRAAVVTTIAEVKVEIDNLASRQAVLEEQMFSCRRLPVEIRDRILS